MAVYKVIQDIEAEDKLLGPLTLKGFIYAAVAGLLIFIDIRLLIGGLPVFIKLLFTALFLPPSMLLAVLALPLGRQQPTEVWLLSHIMFLVKPRTRKWDQSGMKQLVKITAPKKSGPALTKNLSQTEVSSRLQALATTLDSRGWAIKNATVNLPATKPQDLNENSDRLADATTLAESEPVIEVHAADDVLDEQNNPAAQTMESLILEAEEERRKALTARLEAARLEAQEEAREQKRSKEIDEQLAQETPVIRAGATRYPVTHASQAVKLELANAKDLSVATIANLANRKIGPAMGEIEIPLR